ncbi:MAG: EamA family transporter, partial [Actinomycetes bacterium]
MVLRETGVVGLGFDGLGLHRVIGRCDKQDLAGAGGLEHVLAVRGAILADPGAAATGPTVPGRRIVGSSGPPATGPPEEDLVLSTRRGVGAYRWELAMVAVTAVWGSTFVLVRDAVAQIPPFTFIAYRFLAAAVLLAALRPRLAAGGQPGLVAAGVAAGLALFAGYGFQTVGLQYTTASNAGFITGLSVVLTPLFA